MNSNTSRSVSGQVPDPYSVRNNNKIAPQHRGNSYSPYSNHARNPNETMAPAYLDQELPSFEAPYRDSKQAGSILQEDIMMETQPSPYSQEQDLEPQKKQELMDPSTADTKRPWWAKLGLNGRGMVFGLFGFIVFVGIIWYFVWPRDPTLAFLEAGLVENTTASYSTTTMEAAWSVNFTVNNMINWVPTNIQNFAVSVIDVSSGEVFGKGNSGRLSLRPRSLDQIVNVPIYINMTRDATNPTLRNLLGSCWTVNQDVPKQSLNIKFSVVYYIAGIIWHSTSVFGPQSYFICP